MTITVPESRGARRAANWPSRWHYGLLSVLVILAVVYGSLVPLNYSPRGLAESLRQFAEIQYLVLGVERRADWVANLLLFIPLGFCLAGAVLRQRSPGWLTVCWPSLVVLICVAASILLEFAQLWFPPRTVSQNDILAESLGGIVGAVLWIGIGDRFSNWLREFFTTTDRQRKLRWLLEAYTLGLVIYCLLPLDVILGHDELLEKFRLGRFDTFPTGTSAWTIGSALRFGRNILAFLPVGVLTWLLAGQRGTPRHCRLGAVAWGVLLVLALELAQVPLFSRFSSAGDAIAGSLGVLAGCLLSGQVQRLSLSQWPVSSQRPVPSWGLASWQRFSHKRWIWLLATFAYGLLLLAVACFPYDFVDDPRQRAARLEAFWQAPFASLYRGSEFNAIRVVLRDLLLTAPLGFFWGMADRLRQPAPPVGLLPSLPFTLAMVAFCGLLELAQVLVASRHPDMTDILIGTLGAAAAVRLTRYVTAPPR